MNLNALKSFAPAVRRQLIEAIGRKLDYVLSADTPDLRGRKKQIDSLRRRKESNREILVENVAYTWFNRLAALRFIDAREWHPFGMRIITAANSSESQPEILRATRNGALPAELANFTDSKRLNSILDGHIPSNDPQGEVYRHLVLAACRFYHNLMPFLFEDIDDETELLLPDDLLTEHSAVNGFRTDISDDDCSEVEILGWLYQFYISEKKDAVMARKKAVPTEDIPAVTQLFTPHWIVRYLVENSLGRLWLLNHPKSSLREKMPYYIEEESGAGVPPAISGREEAGRKECGAGVSPAIAGREEAGKMPAPRSSDPHFLKITSPEEIRLIDPACGSAHMLTYSFDLLYFIYEEEGHSPNEIPGLILKNNLFGLEICPRAAQLAQFALVCKAREKSRSAFRNPVQPQVMCLENIVISEEEINSWLSETGKKLTQDELFQIHQFNENTSTFGALIKPVLGVEALAALRSKIGENAPPGDLILQDIHRRIILVLNQTEILSQRYHVVVANPPYMGGKGMNGDLKEFAQNNFPDSKSDLFSMFIERGLDMIPGNGFSAMVTMQSWMFLSSYEKLRERLLNKVTIECMAHMANMVMGIAFGTAATIWQKKNITNHKGAFCYIEYEDVVENDKPSTFPPKNNRNKSALSDGLFRAASTDFKKIPGSPIAYWFSAKAVNNCSKHLSLGSLSEAKSGMSSCNSTLFLRQWFEVSFYKINRSASSHEDTKITTAKWYPYNKGGGNRRWYGYNDVVINWENEGYGIKKFVTNNPKDPDTTHWSRRLFNLEYFFKDGLTWSAVTSGRFSLRTALKGVIPGTGSKTLYDLDKRHNEIVFLLLNTNVASYYLSVFSPTLNFEAGDVVKIPIVETIDCPKTIMDSLVRFSRCDWNTSESSWDFTNSPLLQDKYRCRALKKAYFELRRSWKEMTREMQRLEEENNRIFIEAYELQGELTPEVPLNEITLTCNPWYRYGKKCENQTPGQFSEDSDLEARILADTMKEFLSYAIGCMMGRYSLDKPGLILANAGDTLEEYWKIVGKGEEAGIRVQGLGISEDKNLTLSSTDLAPSSTTLTPSPYPLTPKFHPDEDGILPVLDGEWFEDDIESRFRQFLRVTFGDENFEENLRFIEDSLGKDIRKYFLTDFYKDHVQTYKKRPIYWMFQSPKKGFQCLIYMHRYNRDTVNRILNRYLREYLVKLRSRISQLEHELTGEGLSAKDRTRATKELEQIRKTIRECEEYEREVILPLAQKRIEIDLDDGVKVNYLKFGNALVTIPGLAAKEEE
jgi:type II restriction/modification system DNA methylase subunit YeeA